MKKTNIILLVDDNPTTTFLHQLLIHKLNITQELLTVSNGEAAWKLIHQRHEEGKTYPELVLLDLNMPVMDGFEFYKLYEQWEPSKRSAMKVVMLTSSLATKDVQRAKEVGIQYFINKPLTKEKLAAMWPDQISESFQE